MFVQLFNSLLFDSCHVEVTSCVVKLRLSLIYVVLQQTKLQSDLKLSKQGFEAFTAFSNDPSNGKITIHPSPT